ncbi:MAG TPA: alpha/beta hydrolase [Anaerolineales bacterium]|jgi:pimeloyl-ACP methyl ester carboxylesterase
MQCQVRDIKINYEEAGNGRPLLVLHGWPADHHHVMSDMEPFFSQRNGWRRIYPDLPGFGLTRAPDWLNSQDQLLDVMIEFMDALAPGERYAVTGTSYGGYLARGFIHQRGAQIDGIFLHAPAIEGDHTKRELPPKQVLHTDPAFLAAIKEGEQGLLDIVVVQSLERLATFRRDFLPAFALADQAFLERLDQHYIYSFDVDTLPSPFMAPALFLTGRQDNVCGYRDAYRLLENYPHASFAVLDRAGHALAGEQPLLFRALVNEWLDRVEAYRPAA